MTREEAIKHLLHDWHINLGCEFAIKPGRLDDFLAAMDVALMALRGPTREMVERMFPGCALCNWGGLDYVGVDGDGIYLNKPLKDEKFRFCPVCGKPMTDEAVEMVMERMEAVYGQASD